MQDDDSKIALTEERIVVSKDLQAQVLRVYTDRSHGTAGRRHVPLDRCVETPIHARLEGDTRGGAIPANHGPGTHPRTRSGQQRAPLSGP
jgi:hypothetical protein